MFDKCDGKLFMEEKTMKAWRIGIFEQLFVYLAVLLLGGNAILGVSAYHRSQESLFEQIHCSLIWESIL